MSIERPLLLGLLLLGACAHEHGHTRSTPRGAATARAETTGSSESTIDRETRRESETRDREAAHALGTTTPMDQSNDPVDLEITRSIRAAVVGDGSLSFGARNVVIVTRAAVVTLRGDVETAAERTAIDAHAHAAPGVTRVENLLEVSP